jgi:hypothetical protein
MIEGINLTKTYCKHFCKCHSVLPVQQEYDNYKKEIGKFNINIKIKQTKQYWQVQQTERRPKCPWCTKRRCHAAICDLNVKKLL